jgi:hypothetical protein
LICFREVLFVETGPVLKTLPILEQGVSFLKAATKVYNNTTPVAALKESLLGISEVCAPPQILVFPLTVALYSSFRGRIIIKCLKS